MKLDHPHIARAALVLSGLVLGLGAGALLWRPKAAKPPVFTASAAADAVKVAHQTSSRGVDLSDPPSFADAERGFIARPKGKVLSETGAVVWDYDALAFVKGPAPATVNPSLWRQALLNNKTGLFKVADGIWQLRGFDLANLTLIEGRTGWIVVDTLTARETAAAAMAFARQHLGDKQVSAVIFTHSHADHFGGALGVIGAEEAKKRQIPVVAPAGFMEEATSENVLVGPAMGRRAMFMYGSRLPRHPAGFVDSGLGQGVGIGRIGVLAPTVVVEGAHQEIVIDGRRFVFHNVPGSEAPSEFVFEIPELKAFCGAEMLSHTLHNLYTLRGAKVRDALKWADYIDRSLAYVQDADVVFNQHHWPVWGRERIVDFMVKQRDTYRFIHDQTLRLANQGATPREIAETLELPPPLAKGFWNRGYYGTLRHNALRAGYALASFTSDSQRVMILSASAHSAVLVNGERLTLSATEYRLLEFLVRRAESVVTRDQLSQHVWGGGTDPSSNVVDVYVGYVRRKLQAAYPGTLIQTVRGLGYMLKHANHDE